MGHLWMIRSFYLSRDKDSGVQVIIYVTHKHLCYFKYNCIIMTG